MVERKREIRSAFLISRRVACWMLAGSLLVAAGTARSLWIDRFETDQSTAVLTPDTSASDEASGTGMIGGERDITVTRTSGVGVTAITSMGTFAYGHIAASEGMGTLVWDGPDGSPILDAIGLGGVDFTDGGLSSAISMSVLFDDFSAPLILTVYTDADNFSEATVMLPGGIPPDPQALLLVPFKNFTAVGGTGADFTDVGAFSITIDGSSTPALDVEIDSIQTTSTPEPSPAALLTGGLVVLAWLGRRTSVPTGRSPGTKRSLSEHQPEPAVHRSVAGA
jgi:hypothetical protein